MTILDRIVKSKQEEVRIRKADLPLSCFPHMEAFHLKCHSLRDSIRAHPVFGIIAEIKRASPSAGVISRSSIDTALVAEQYEAAGAGAISVLTDGPYFSGSLEDLRAVRKATSLPLLRKDFIIDDYQLHEAKASGADAVLLIAGILEKHQLSDLHSSATELGMECLVELYNLAELDILDTDRMGLVGVNNRDLHTFSVDIARTFEIASHLPSNITVVSESGIHDAATLRLFKARGIRAALIGEYFMRAQDPGSALASLLREVDG